jgi:hypothetical protein
MVNLAVRFRPLPPDKHVRRETEGSETELDCCSSHVSILARVLARVSIYKQT